MVRRAYRHELRSALTFPLAGSLAEGSFTGVIAAKNFGAGVVLMALITAAPMFGNIMAIVWSNVAMGRRKVPMVNALQLGVVLMIASVALCALLPPAIAGWIFAAQIIIARLLVSGIITIRSTIWRANYPRSVRGQITSRIAVVAGTVLATTTLLGSYLLDHDSRAFVFLYPGAALLGVIGIWQFSKIRVRREVLLIRAEEQLYAPRPESMSQTEEANVMNYAAPVARRSLIDLFRDAYRVLKEDKAFREYQRYQMLSGFSFMLFGPSLLYMVSTEMTDRRTQYMLATVVVQIIPMVVALACQQLWAPLFDRVHVSVFRVYQVSISVAAQLLLFAGAISGNGMTALAIIAMAQVLVGASNAGGNLAWNLGHNDFAPAEKAATYMGVHVMLTGVRGFIAPFLGSWLYLMPGIGRGIFGISALVCLCALVGFVRMAGTRRRRRERHRS
jgi:hypothetical protein